jgi:predicted transcriptional regulator
VVNQRVRTEMFKRMLTQNDLAKILDVSVSEVSHILKYDMSKKQQDEIVAKIRTATKKQKEE